MWLVPWTMGAWWDTLVLGPEGNQPECLPCAGPDGRLSAVQSLVDVVAVGPGFSRPSGYLLTTVAGRPSVLLAQWCLASLPQASSPSSTQPTEETNHWVSNCSRSVSHGRQLPSCTELGFPSLPEAAQLKPSLPAACMLIGREKRQS